MQTSTLARLSGLRELLPYLTPQQQQEIDLLLAQDQWLPLPGPQTAAYNSKADVLYYGGSAGGGKTDLLIGLALTQHKRAIIFRREATQLEGIYDRCAEIIGHRTGFNGHDKVWRLPNLKLEFGSCKDAGSESAYQGRPHDLKAFDEVPLFMEQQFRFLNGWKRTTVPGQRCRTVAAGNPPTDSDGEWVMRYWAPWLDDKYPHPAEDGEIRWFAVLNGKDVEVESGEPFHWKGEPDLILPHSRSFIRSMVQDNPFLMESGYEQTLQALPEPLRSQMLRGDFKAGRGDDPWQVLPTGWVRAAMDRWQPRERKGVMTAMGVDVARGGADYTVLAPRHANWYDHVQALPGAATPDGPTVAGLVVGRSRDGASIHVDVIGVGASVYDFLEVNHLNVTGVNVAERSDEFDKSGRLGFINKRAEICWKFREALDPASDEGVMLPPDDQLLSDLCAPRWKVTQRGIQVESREDIIKRIGRSPDRGSAVLLASIAPFERYLPTPRTGRKFV